LELIMERMNRYYLTRLPVAAGLGALLVALGQPWYASVAAGVIALAFFFWASRGARYVGRSGSAGLRRDELDRDIAGRSARVAFAVTSLALGGLALFVYISDRADVPAAALLGVLAGGWVAYYAADFWQRRA
jgi:hypothetical protein